MCSDVAADVEPRTCVGVETNAASGAGDDGDAAASCGSINRRAPGERNFGEVIDFSGAAPRATSPPRGANDVAPGGAIGTIDGAAELDGVGTGTLRLGNPSGLFGSGGLRTGARLEGGAVGTPPAGAGATVAGVSGNTTFGGEMSNSLGNAGAETDPAGGAEGSGLTNVGGAAPSGPFDIVVEGPASMTVGGENGGNSTVGPRKIVPVVGGQTSVVIDDRPGVAAPLRCKARLASSSSASSS